MLSKACRCHPTRELQRVSNFRPKIEKSYINWGKKISKQGSCIKCARCEFYLPIIANSIYTRCSVPAWDTLLLSSHSELGHTPSSSKMNQKYSFCILLIISHRLSNFRVHGYLLQGVKGWPCSFCYIIFWMALFSYFDSGRLSLFSGGARPGYGSQMCPLVWEFSGNSKTRARTIDTSLSKKSKIRAQF